MCALPLRDRRYHFTSRDQLCGFFQAAAIATAPLANEVVFNGNGGWDEFRNALMDTPELSDEMFAKEDLLGWRISELWKGVNTVNGSSFSILNVNSTAIQYTPNAELKAKLELLNQSTFYDDELQRIGIERPSVQKPADLVCISNASSKTASMQFTMYDTSPPNEFGKPRIYKPWQREVTWGILNPEILETEAVQKMLQPNWTP